MATEPRGLNCRACAAPLTHLFADLGRMPIANAFRRPTDDDAPEQTYPLRAFVCDLCWLVQLQDYRTPESLFTDDYIYSSSYSDSWLHHARVYADLMIRRLSLDAAARVVEVASNDGYLLRHFKVRGIPALGIEPAATLAEEAERNHGIETVQAFFGANEARRLRGLGFSADLLVANNVLAHVPDINDFVAGVAILLKSKGTATFEFPHLLNLIRLVQFDTIYHEHYSYLSLLAVESLLSQHRLKVVDVEKMTTHGGSLRLFVNHADYPLGASPRLEMLRAEEQEFGIGRLNTYRDFDRQVRATKRALLTFMIQAKNADATIAGYGAPAKANTLLNYCGIGTDFIDYTVDRNPRKQGMFLPGTGIPVHDPQRIFETRPNYLLILPWNIKDEIMRQMAGIDKWGGRFVVPMPTLEIIG